jgi:hypothetical protein
MYGHDRRQMREVFFRAWQRHRGQQPLTGVEPLIVAVALRHPEYHALLQDPDSQDRDFSAESSQANPFLHMGMHIAIEEQLGLDQPSGVRAHYQTLLKHGLDEHTAQHHMMDCMGEMLWQAGRQAATPDPKIYLNCLAQLCGTRAVGR